MKPNSQNNIIRAWLNEGHAITPLEALDLCGCFRLSERIRELQKSGMQIEKHMTRVNNSRVMRYWKA